MRFGTLVVILLAGLGGPLLGIAERALRPGRDRRDPRGHHRRARGSRRRAPVRSDASFLAEIGFAMLMLTVGMHLPLRDPRLSAALRGGAVLAVIVAALAVPAGLLAASIAGTSHVAIYAVLLASGSAAVLLPALEETGIAGPDVMTVMAQVTIADVITILSVPIVLQPARVGHAVLGALLVAAGVLLLLGLARALADRAWVGRGAPHLQAAALGAGPAPVADRSVPARVDRPEGRHERADRGVRRRPDGRGDRRPETPLDADARRCRRLLHPAVLRGARRAAGRRRALRTA